MSPTGGDGLSGDINEIGNIQELAVESDPIGLGWVAESKTGAGGLVSTTTADPATEANR